MKNGFARLAVIGGVFLVAALLVMAPPAHPNNDEDNLWNRQFSGTVAQSGLNPCNQQTVSGQSNVTVSYLAQGVKRGRPEVFITVGYNGKQADAAGNAYSVSGSGFAVFTTLTDHYTIPMKLDYQSQSAGARSFTGSLDSTVQVDANQTPTNVSAKFFPASCEQK